MLTKFIKFMVAKSVSTDFVKMAVKSSRDSETVVQEKLGVSTIDEFMKMDYQTYRSKK